VLQYSVNKSDKMLITLKKMTCLGVLERGERGDDNETSLKEGEVIEMSTTVLPFTITIITIYYSDTINISKLEKKIIFTIITN
jgi:hypothetical protein